MISRPLYWPQCGQTRCGSFFSWQFGQEESPTSGSASWARRLPRRALEIFRFGLAISLSQRLRSRSGAS